MDPKRIVALVVGASVMVLIFSALLVPIINDATTTEKTFKNSGLYYMTNPTETMHVEYLGSNNWEINDEPLNYTIAGATNILIFDDIFVRNNGQVRGSATASWDSADLTIANGTVTGTQVIGGNSTSLSWTYTDSFVAVNGSAEWVMKAYNQESYIKSDSEIIGMGMTQVKDADGNNALITCYVSVSDLTATVTTSNTSVTISDVVVNATPVSGYIDLYQFTSVTFKATWGTNVTPCTYNVVIVPASVTAELTVHPDSATNALLSAIPIIAMIGIVLAVVGVAIVGRNDY